MESIRIIDHSNIQNARLEANFQGGSMGALAVSVLVFVKMRPFISFGIRNDNERCIASFEKHHHGGILEILEKFSICNPT